MDFVPPFVQHMQDPKVKSVLIEGCGGGFDFTHSIIFVPMLLEMGKKVIFVSNSFTSQFEFEGNYECVFKDDEKPRHKMYQIIPKKIDHSRYIPEAHFVNYINENFGEDGWIFYATGSSKTDEISNQKMYDLIYKKHGFDMMITIDGGSDSIMRGDEHGIATIYEDYTSLISFSDFGKTHPIIYKDLLILGLGCDRFHGASDASSLRAIAELTRMGGFLGSISLIPGTRPVEVYSNLHEYMAARMDMKSIIGSMILASAVGQYGPVPDHNIKAVPRNMKKIPKSAAKALNLKADGSNWSSCGNSRVNPSTTYIWPLMSTVFGFDIETVLARCDLKDIVRRENQKDYIEAYRGRVKMPVEDIPRQSQFSKE